MPTTLPDLIHYTGSEGYFYDPFYRGINYTDGVKYVKDNGAAWLVMDVLAVLKNFPAVSGLDFVVIEWNPETLTVTYKDDDRVVYKQQYVASDLMVPVRFFCVDQILLLDREY